MMSPFDAFRVYQSVKLHFTSKTYDCIKYNFKTTVNPSSFEKRRDKYFFGKVAKKFKADKQLAEFYASYFIEDKTYIMDMVDNDEIYNAWNKKIQSLVRTFELDIKNLNEKCDTFDCLFEIDGNYPILINEYLCGRVQIETVVILNKLTHFMNKADGIVSDTLFYPELSNKIRKYGSFVEVNIDKMKKIILSNYIQ